MLSRFNRSQLSTANDKDSFDNFQAQVLPRLKGSKLPTSDILSADLKISHNNL